MARLNDDAQWIVLMGFVVSFSLFFLAVMLNQSTVVGQTTAESVSEFPKEDIRGLRLVIINSMPPFMDGPNQTRVQDEIRLLSDTRQNSFVNYSMTTDPSGLYNYYQIHYNNGVTSYNETWTFPKKTI
jgi:hypothetical protein